ncbi:MAG: sensor domain-containing diguanylate cyclase [Chloroflexi bacterium]|nr:sensor domain-containing diguanylate cyclase [Chloroflexota bacterium]
MKTADNEGAHWGTLKEEIFQRLLDQFQILIQCSEVTFTSGTLDNEQPGLELPLVYEGRQLGQIRFLRHWDQPFSKFAVDRAHECAHLFALILEASRLFDQQFEQLQETRALLQAAQSILGAEDLPTICQRLDSACHQLVQADRTSLYIVDHKKRQVIEWADDGEEDERLSYEELEAGISGIVFRTGQPVLSLHADDGIEPPATRQRRIERGVGALIVVPLTAQDEVIGTITTANKVGRRPFNEHDVELLMYLADSAAAAVNNIRALEMMKSMSARLEQLSYQDSLTGLYNRAYFEDRLKKLQAGGRWPISVISLDIDHLKQVNDSSGHAAGDELLQAMASVIRSAFRKSDTAARIGGDEFVILLEGASQAVVEKAVARLREAINKWNAARSGPQAANGGNTSSNWELSASIGAATGEAGCRLVDVLSEADERMYQEKRSRNVKSS